MGRETIDEGSIEQTPLPTERTINMSFEEYEKEIEQVPEPNQRILDSIDSFRDIRDSERQYTLVSGSFDMLHAGHLQSLNSVLRHAPDNSLVVALDDDEYIQRRKDKLPVFPFEIRSKQLAGTLALTDRDFWVIRYNPTSNNNYELISAVQPSLMMYSESEGRENDIDLVEMFIKGEAKFLRRSDASFGGEEISSSNLRKLILQRLMKEA